MYSGEVPLYGPYISGRDSRSSNYLRLDNLEVRVAALEARVQSYQSMWDRWYLSWSSFFDYLWALFGGHHRVFYLWTSGMADSNPLQQGHGIDP